MSPRQRRRIFAGVFLALAGLYGLTQSGRFHVIDEYETFFTAQSILERGELAMPQVAGSEHFFGKVGRDGKPYAPYGIGQPLVTLPFLAAGRALEPVLPAPAHDPELWQWVAASFSVAIVSALAMACFALWLLDRGAGPRAAVAGALILGTATLVWAYATQYRSNSLVLAGYVVLLAASRRSGAAADLLRVVVAFLLILVRKDAVVGIAILEGYRALALGAPVRWSRWAPCAAGAAFGLAVALTLNALHFGDPFDEGYPAVDDLGRAAYRFGAPDPIAAAALLVSPGKGLLLLSPILALALVRWPAAWRRARPEALLAMAMGLSHVALFSAWQHWEGGWCFGPRFLLPIVPFVLLPMVLCPPSLPAGSPARRGWTAAVAFAVAAGVAVNLLAVSVNFLEAAHGAGYYVNLTDPSAPLSYNVWHAPLGEHARRLAACLADLAAGRELAKPPGSGLDFWWVFALKEGVPAGWVAALAAPLAAALALGAGALSRAVARGEGPSASPSASSEPLETCAGPDARRCSTKTA